MTSDLDLLRQFARENSQDAFAEIVRRHLNLVYSAALRQVRSPQLAEEIAQSVFADLARVAATPSSPLSGCDASSQIRLTPWLYAVTRRTAIDVIRKESRRQLREQIAVEMNNMNATANDWTQIEPLLDDAMAALDETDRSAVLLRYFENKSLREVGEALGASEDAAQKRVSRAVERLREFFSKRNVTIGASGLAVLISANAVQSAPVATGKDGYCSSHCQQHSGQCSCFDKRNIEFIDMDEDKNGDCCLCWNLDGDRHCCNLGIIFCWCRPSDSRSGKNFRACESTILIVFLI